MVFCNTLRLATGLAINDKQISGIDRIGFGNLKYNHLYSSKYSNVHNYLGGTLRSYTEQSKFKTSSAPVKTTSNHSYYPRSEKYIEDLNKARACGLASKHQLEINNNYEKSRNCTCNPAKRFRKNADGTVYKVCSCSFRESPEKN